MFRIALRLPVFWVMPLLIAAGMLLWSGPARAHPHHAMPVVTGPAGAVQIAAAPAPCPAVAPALPATCPCCLVCAEAASFATLPGVSPVHPTPRTVAPHWMQAAHRTPPGLHPCPAQPPPRLSV